MFAKTNGDFWANLLPETKLLAAETKTIKTLLISEVVRRVAGEDVVFLALKNIEVREKYQRQGIFKKVLKRMLEFQRPIMLDDILNDNVERVGRRFGMIPFEYRKNGKTCKCLIRI